MCVCSITPNYLQVIHEGQRHDCKLHPSCDCGCKVASSDAGMYDLYRSYVMHLNIYGVFKQPYVRLTQPIPTHVVSMKGCSMQCTCRGCCWSYRRLCLPKQGMHQHTAA